MSDLTISFFLPFRSLSTSITYHPIFLNIHICVDTCIRGLQMVTNLHTATGHDHIRMMMYMIHVHTLSSSSSSFPPNPFMFNEDNFFSRIASHLINFAKVPPPRHTRGARSSTDIGKLLYSSTRHASFACFFNSYYFYAWSDFMGWSLRVPYLPHHAPRTTHHTTHPTSAHLTFWPTLKQSWSSRIYTIFFLSLPIGISEHYTI